MGPLDKQFVPAPEYPLFNILCGKFHVMLETALPPVDIPRHRLCGGEVMITATKIQPRRTTHRTLPASAMPHQTSEVRLFKRCGPRHAPHKLVQVIIAHHRGRVGSGHLHLITVISRPGKVTASAPAPGGDSAVNSLRQQAHFSVQGCRTPALTSVGFKLVDPLADQLHGVAQPQLPRCRIDCS